MLSPEDGLPSPEINVALEKLDSKTWGMLNSGVTNEQDHVPLLRSSYRFSTYRGNRCLEFETSEATDQKNARASEHESPLLVPLV